MCIKYIDYKNFGYSLIPGEEFERYSAMAEKTIRRFIKNGDSEFTEFTDENKRGICEVADILYADNNQLNNQLAGYSNENYREQYFRGARLSPSEKIWEIAGAYFSREQLHRGV